MLCQRVKCDQVILCTGWKYKCQWSSVTEMTHAEGLTGGNCSYCFILDVQVSFPQTLQSRSKWVTTGKPNAILLLGTNFFGSCFCQCSSLWECLPSLQGTDSASPLSSLPLVLCCYTCSLTTCCCPSAGDSIIAHALVSSLHFVICCSILTRAISFQ